MVETEVGIDQGRINSLLAQYPEVVMFNARRQQLHIGWVKGRLHWATFSVTEDGGLVQKGEVGRNGLIQGKSGEIEEQELKRVTGESRLRGFAVSYRREAPDQRYRDISHLVY